MNEPARVGGLPLDFAQALDHIVNWRDDEHELGGQVDWELPRCVCHFAILPFCHFATLPFCHFAILPFCHFSAIFFHLERRGWRGYDYLNRSLVHTTQKKTQEIDPVPSDTHYTIT